MLCHFGNGKKMLPNDSSGQKSKLMIVSIFWDETQKSFEVSFYKSFKSLFYSITNLIQYVCNAFKNM